MHGGPTIFLPRNRWLRWTLYHELAHCTHGRLASDHGPQFTASYLRLVRACWDPAVADRLAAFVERVARGALWADSDAPIPMQDPAPSDDRRDPGTVMLYNMALTYNTAMLLS